MAKKKVVAWTPVRSEPLVWFKRLVIYRSLDPLDEIRSIELRPGINVIWGVESNGTKGKFEPGHGVGKTTFCRLLRYCLGEDSFGQQHVVEEIRETYTDAYVAAEIRVDGKTWAVVRPLGRDHRASYAKPVASIRELIADKAKGAFAAFASSLQTVCLQKVRCESILSNGDSFQWAQLLAMCSRDQEARYDRFSNWRHARSASGTPAFRKVPVDASLCVRALLNLLKDDESDLRKKVNRQTDDLAQVETDLTVKKVAPSYYARKMRETLQNELGVAGAVGTALYPSNMLDLSFLVADRAKYFEQVRDDANTEVPNLIQQINMASVALSEPAELEDQESAAIEATDLETTGLLKDIKELRDLRQSILNVSAIPCKYGRIPIGECDYVKAELARLNSELTEAQRENLPEVARREQMSAALTARKNRHAELLKVLQKRLNGYIEQRDGKLEAARTAEAARAKLFTVLEELKEWEAILKDVSPNLEYLKLVEQKKKRVADLEVSKAELRELMTKQNEKVRQLRETFEKLVQRTLTAAFTGKLKVSELGMVFRIFRGETLSGEAYDTLSVILADWALLVMGVIGKARHPGILIHDSPREADLGESIYARFLTLTGDLASELTKDGNAAFQYVVTTTTPPPKSLKRGAKKLGGKEGPLFREQLKPPPETTPGLFDELDDGSA